MGHRALVAWERHDGTYDVHYSHWGASAERPIASDRLDLQERDQFVPDAWPRDLLYRIGIVGADVGGRVREPDPVAVDPEPVAVGIGFDELVGEYLDVLVHEAVVVLPRSGSVRPFFPLSTDVDPVSRAEQGALVEMDPANYTTDVARFRGWLDGSRAAFAAVVDRGLLDRATARSLLVDRLLSYAGDDREVLLV